MKTYAYFLFLILKNLKYIGPVIHEFDPYFNFRATEYLYEHGRAKFFKWFDYMSWYPLGRPVGTTIYPGMQFTAVWIKNHIVGDAMSLNDVCCYIPAWFGAIATIFTALIAYECSLPVDSEKEGPYTNILEQVPILRIVYKQVVSPVVELLMQTIEFVFGTDFGLRLRSTIPTKYGYVDLSSPAIESALIAGFIMSVVPAHMMRSIGGGYDNESVAMTAMTMTFFFWTRTLRGDKYVLTWKTWVMGALTGASYFYVSFSSVILNLTNIF
jgi:hypothetical protein